MSAARAAANGRRAGPNVERGDVPVPYVLLVHRVERDLLQREGDFYEAFVVSGHSCLCEWKIG